MKPASTGSGFAWDDAGHTCAHKYLLPKVFEILDSFRKVNDTNRIFDLGCGNGSVTNALVLKGFQAQGIDASEVVEHVFLPRQYARTLFDLIEPGGIAVLSTPYHGYLKNLVMALTGTLDKHFDVLHDYGHIKFWSVKTLSKLLKEVGFDKDLHFYYAGRVPFLSKSMIVVAHKPR